MLDIIVFFCIFVMLIIICVMCVLFYEIRILKEERYKDKKQMRQIIEEQYEEIQHLGLILESQNTNIERKEKLIEIQANDIQELWRSSLLQQNLNKQIVIYSDKKIGILENKYTKIVNSYKILFFRKMSNLILEDIIKQYNDNLCKTDDIFLNEEKPNEKQKKFSIIIVRKDVDNIKGIEKNLINLIIDFLMYIKDVCSSIIHISKKNYLFQIEILSEYIGREIIKDEKDDKYYIKALDLINILFDKDEISQNDYNKINLEKNSELLKGFNDEKKLSKKINTKDFIVINGDKHREDKEIKVENCNEEKKISQDKDANNNMPKNEFGNNNNINVSLEKNGDKKNLVNEINKKGLTIQKNENNKNKENEDTKEKYFSKNEKERIINEIIKDLINIIMNIDKVENKQKNMNEVIIINHKMNKSEDREKKGEFKE